MKTRANHYTNPMKMKYPITILFLLLSISIFSQREIIYDLDSYKQVVFKRSELILTPAGSFSGNDQLNVDGEDDEGYSLCWFQTGSVLEAGKLVQH